jgi:spermidine/putrescine-binding protein
MTLKGWLGAAFGAVLMVSGSGSAYAEKLVISNWDGYMPKDMAEKFKAATGIDLEVAVHATNEEIMGKVTASGGEGYDVLFVSSPFAEALNNLGLIAPIDHSKIPNIGNLYPGPRNSSMIRAMYSRSPIPGARQGSATAPIFSRPNRRAGMTFSSHRTRSRARPPCWLPTAG